MALGQGMHTDTPLEVVGESGLERLRRTWWTVYILERELTSSQGLPHSIYDDDVLTPWPMFAGSEQQRKELSLRVSLTRLVTKINRSKQLPFLELSWLH